MTPRLRIDIELMDEMPVREKIATGRPRMGSNSDGTRSHRAKARSATLKKQRRIKSRSF